MASANLPGTEEVSKRQLVDNYYIQNNNVYSLYYIKYGSVYGEPCVS